MALEPAEYNKPCLMTYGEIAERLTLVLQSAEDEALMLFPDDPAPAGQVVELAHFLAAGVLKLEKVDVR